MSSTYLHQIRSLSAAIHELDLLRKQEPDEVTVRDKLILPPEITNAILIRNLREIADHINVAYSIGLYTACLILMRKFIEGCLIKIFEIKKLSSLIKDSNGDYYFLTRIAETAIQNATIDLSRNTKKHLMKLVNRGNLAAHNVYYSAKRCDIENIEEEFRQIGEELLHRSDYI